MTKITLQELKDMELEDFIRGLILFAIGAALMIIGLWWEFTTLAVIGAAFFVIGYLDGTRERTVFYVYPEETEK